MASMGGVVYSFAHPRHVSNEVGSEQALKAKELLQVIHFLGCKRVNIVAHSEAAVNVVLAAREKPHLFGKLILVAPSGLVGGSSYACHLTRFGLHLTRVFLQLLRRDYTVKAWQILKDMGVYLAANPARALREAKEIAGACIISDLEEIARHGVEVEVFVQLSDLAYKASRIQEELAGLDIQVHMVQGGHSQICLNPEEISV
jgi:pimeloyl-ACP methyl ester carboxylesterase